MSRTIPGSSHGWARWRACLAAGAVLMGGLAACGGGGCGGDPPPERAPRQVAQPGGAGGSGGAASRGGAAERITTASSLLSRADLALARQQKRVERYPDRWLERKRLASGWLSRYRISGRFEDLRAAADALAEARAISGVVAEEVDVAVALACHRSTEAAAQLDRLEGRVLVGSDIRQAIRRGRAQIALEAGRFDEARRLLEEGLAQRRDAQGLAAYALYLKRIGDVSGADAALAEVGAQLASRDPLLAAWAAVERARLRLDVGDPRGAAAQAEVARAALPGFWRADAVSAAAAVASAEAGAAEHLRAAYAASGDPELLEAQAQLAFAAGDRAGSRRLLAEAGAAWEVRYAALPEAYATHLVSHLLKTGADPARAVAISGEAARLRPGSDAAVIHVRALLAAGEVEAAAAAVDAIRATSLWTPDLDDVSIDALTRAGRGEDAAAVAAARAHRPAPVLP